MRFSRARITAPSFAALLLLCVVETAAAEPVTLTSGGVFYFRQDLAQIEAVSLSGISLKGLFGNQSEAWNPDHACSGCTPGTRIDLSQSESFTSTSDSTEDLFLTGFVKADDVLYGFDSMSFRINAAHFAIPDTSGNAGAPVNAGVFVFHSVIVGTSDAGITRTFRFHGKGTVSVLFGNNNWFATDYKFSDASIAPVPEPGTLLLFGSGAVAALVRRRKQRQQS